MTKKTHQMWLKLNEAARALVQQKQYEALGKFEIAQCIRGVADDLEEEFLEGRP